MGGWGYDGYLGETAGANVPNNFVAEEAAQVGCLPRVVS